ncbi:hypothetical protein KAR91_06520, partial [Candidatus Pacearchaeota archaeon]|nr:hypothetical protein [Candidatus Pacearchaeota archaeon]
MTNHYVTQNGAGTRNGSSLANAFSITDFNSLTGTGYAGDTFYFSGLFTTQIHAEGLSGTHGNYITLDGWKGGTCNPVADRGCPFAAKISLPRVNSEKYYGIY